MQCQPLLKHGDGVQVGGVCQCYYSLPAALTTLIQLAVSFKQGLELRRLWICSPSVFLMQWIWWAACFLVGQWMTCHNNARRYHACASWLYSDCATNDGSACLAQSSWPVTDYAKADKDIFNELAEKANLPRRGDHGQPHACGQLLTQAESVQLSLNADESLCLASDKYLMVTLAIVYTCHSIWYRVSARVNDSEYLIQGFTIRKRLTIR